MEGAMYTYYSLVGADIADRLYLSFTCQCIYRHPGGYPPILAI